MRHRLALALAALLSAGAAQAQIKCWNDANGRRVCGDTPPAGAKVTTVRTPGAPTPPAAAPAESGQDDADRAARKGPLTPAEREQEYRKRQIEAQKAAEKSRQEEQLARLKRENCESARQNLRSLESGARVVRTDDKGERFYLDDAQREQEVGRARQRVRENCE